MGGVSFKGNTAMTMMEVPLDSLVGRAEMNTQGGGVANTGKDFQSERHTSMYLIYIKARMPASLT